MHYAASQFCLTAPGPWQCLNPDLVTSEWVWGGRGGFWGFDFTWRRSHRAQPPNKSNGCGGCLWVRVGHRSAPHPNLLSVASLLLFLSSIYLSFQWRGRAKRNNGLLLPPLSSQQRGCILNRGHNEPKAYLPLLSPCSPLLSPGFTAPCRLNLLPCITTPLSFCLGSLRSEIKHFCRFSACIVFLNPSPTPSPPTFHSFPHPNSAYPVGLTGLSPAGTTSWPLPQQNN